MAEDKSRLAEVMRMWASTLPNSPPVTPLRVANYRLMLKGMTHEQFERGVEWLNKNAKWFPTPADIWRAARNETWL